MKYIITKKDSSSSLMSVTSQKTENSRLGLIVSVHVRYWKMQHPSRPLAAAKAVFCFQMSEPNSSKVLENLEIKTLCRCTGRRFTAATCPNDSYCDL